MNSQIQSYYLDDYIINNILSYINNRDYIFINKYYYNIYKLKYLDAINKIINFYKYNKLRLQYEFEIYEDIKSIHNYYILYYPTKYRLDLMESAISNLNTEYRPYIIFLHHLSKTHNNKSKFYFKYFIRLLNRNELAYLGW